ncbi:MAG: SIMPL domain-containing protein [Candidatus Tumulicola sp.]
MSRIFLIFLVALSVATAPAVAADQPAGTAAISVSGTGSVALPPDMATVSANVETTAANANEAVASNNARYDRIVAALEKVGIARGDVTLSYYSVNYNPKPQVMPPNPSGERYGYTVSRGFDVKVRDIGKAGRVADACTSSGATSINGVNFGLADSSGPRAQAIKKAVDDARTTAAALAAAANLRIVSIKSIDLGGGGVVSPQPMMRMAAANASPTQFDQSNVNVSISVNVTFLAQP